MFGCWHDKFQKSKFHIIESYTVSNIFVILNKMAVNGFKVGRILHPSCISGITDDDNDSFSY